MNHMGIKTLWACGCLLCFFKGVFGEKVPDEYVTLLGKVTAWKGACVLLPCTYSFKHGESIHNFTWYHNAVYIKAIKDYTGTVVFNSKDNKDAGELFAERVQYIGTAERDCTIMISDLQKEHEGAYQLRLRGESSKAEFKDTGFRWMSKNNVIITVSDNETSLDISAPKEITELQSVTLRCSVNYYCPNHNISLTWMGNVNGTKRTDVRQDTSDLSTTTYLTFVPTWEDDKESVTCAFRQGGEREETRTLVLDVKHAPKNVQILPNNSTIKINKWERVTLHCTVGSSNPPVSRVHWYKNSKKIDLTSLQNKYEVTESGKYHCTAGNSISSVESNTIEVSVLYAPIKPVIKKPEGDVKEGSTITLTCYTHSNPRVIQYIWYKDDKELSRNTDNHFTIVNIKNHDSGTYKCSARNDISTTMSHTLFVDVMYPPKNPVVVLTPDRTAFVEGTLVTFDCVVNSSNPDVSNVAWYKDDVRRTFPKRISIKAEDAGMYYCEAANRVGTTKSSLVQVNVHHPPRSVQLKVSSTTVREGDDITFECKPGASNPEIKSYEWYKNGNLQETTESTHKFLQAKWTDSGRYTCKAVNDIGKKESSPVPIDVQYAPRNVTASIFPDRHVSESMDVKLTCAAVANPSQVSISWYLNNKLHKSRSKSLSLQDVQLTAAGEYYCQVANDVGVEKSNAILLRVSYSMGSIGKFAAIAVSSFLLLIIIIFLIIRFRTRIRNTCYRKKVDDSSFFVLKKSRNDPLDNGRQTPSAGGSLDQLNCPTLNFSSSIRGPVIIPRSEIDNDDISTIYSVVKKNGSTPEYENIESSRTANEETQEDVHYSEIANLSKDVKRWERGSEVEYAMLKQ